MTWTLTPLKACDEAKSDVKSTLVEFCMAEAIMRYFIAGWPKNLPRASCRHPQMLVAL